MLTLLIPGKNDPSREIDVYLRQLINELKELWEIGVRTYYKVTNSMFNLRAAVMYTINDFPAYGNLSRWSTSGHALFVMTIEHLDGSVTRFAIWGINSGYRGIMCGAKTRNPLMGKLKRV
ncbi:hypothetical protein LWI28_008413 [Acer negundo]|uniref:Uncharacterized protein n=1 Tax=Acer negundo TaxID=4023 RepID=A0AAD5JEN7_ACENE|nr:hypothetical protein LWI28_002198 [Acer negundo]KAI9198003.1 hypothetical protein LWI28_008413 [Acer negundo]